MKVYICSPYGGKEENYMKAIDYCREAAQEGHTPFASHVMLHNILDDNNELQRTNGLQAGLAMLSMVNEVWVYGDTISAGMSKEIEIGKQLGLKIVFKGAKQGKALFTRKAVDIEELKERTGSDRDKKPFIIEKTICLTAEEYKFFCENLLWDHDFIEKEIDNMFVDKYGVYHCILVKEKDAEDGVLVESEGYNYARYASYYNGTKK